MGVGVGVKVTEEMGTTTTAVGVVATVVGVSVGTLSETLVSLSPQATTASIMIAANVHECGFKYASPFSCGVSVLTSPRLDIIS